MTRWRVAELLGLLSTAEVTTVEKPWGQEFIVDFGDGLLKVIRVDEDKRTSRQHHVEKDEVIFILHGTGTVEGMPDTGERPSQGFRVRPGIIHRSVGPVLLLELSTNHPDDVVRHHDDYGRAS